MSDERLWLSDSVRGALDAGRPVVALESSLIAHGLPPPHNLETALAAESAVREEGAVPATVALQEGRLVVGAERPLLERMANGSEPIAKAASRDIGPLLATRRAAATTVSATLRVAAMAGISTFATGGIGGVHRGASATFDVSSDIDELASTPLAVVCSGAKSILDLPATMELLETRRVPVIGLGTDELPAFYSAASGLPLAYRVDDIGKAAAVVTAHLSLPGTGAILLVQPPPPEVAIPADALGAWLSDALAAAEREGVRGGAVTPYVLGRVAEASSGQTLRANIGLIVNNARTAARLARALAG